MKHAPGSLGSFSVQHSGSLQAGGYCTFVVTFTVGQHGMDDKSSIRLGFHGAKDHVLPQFTDPKGVSYTTATTSAGVKMVLSFNAFGGQRPWFNNLEAFLAEGGLAPGDTITIVIGDTSQGSPGFGIQTVCQDTMKFKMLVNLFSTNRYVELEQLPYFTIAPGEPEQWKAVLPSLRAPSAPFTMRVKCEDHWGNPSDLTNASVRVRANMPVNNLPETVTMTPGQFAVDVPNLSVDEEGDLVIELLSDDGQVAATTNPLRIKPHEHYKMYWGDLHGQTEETIGVNTADRYFEFARDKSFMDVCGHQGNDFQITDAFWSRLNDITKSFDEPGRFVAFPGYEWSGNTAVGGDRNVWYRDEGGAIHRSHRALIEEPMDGSDATTAHDLFAALEGKNAVVTAHCGGRWADINYAHDGKVETAVEIHSAWGTFEWLVQDAFANNYRVGIVGNSDGHKGRPGASYPGRMIFASLGGLTCFLADDLDRDSIFDAFRRRHHYATTGHRPFMDIKARAARSVQVFDQDPAVFGEAVSSAPAEFARMGDIAAVDSDEVEVTINLHGTAPILKVDIYDGPNLLETVHPQQVAADSSRIRIGWGGARYRGRGRNQAWQGTISTEGNKILDMTLFNVWNPELVHALSDDGTSIDFTGISAGTFQGVDLLMESGTSGRINVKTNVGEGQFEIADLAIGETQQSLGGLDLCVYGERLAQTFSNQALELVRKIPVAANGDTRIYVRVTQMDGHQSWTSPMYLFRK